MPNFVINAVLRSRGIERNGIPSSLKADCISLSLADLSHCVTVEDPDLLAALSSCGIF